jgi:hypothetical protein
MEVEGGGRCKRQRNRKEKKKGEDRYTRSSPLCADKKERREVRREREESGR